MDFPKVYRCCQWLMCCKSMEHWQEAMDAVSGEVKHLPVDDETRRIVKRLSTQHYEDLKAKEADK